MKAKMKNKIKLLVKINKEKLLKKLLKRKNFSSVLFPIFNSDLILEGNMTISIETYSKKEYVLYVGDNNSLIIEKEEIIDTLVEELHKVIPVKVKITVSKKGPAIEGEFLIVK